MRHVVRHIASMLLLAAVVLCGMSSCIYDDLESDGTPDPAADGRELFVLHIAPVNAGSLPNDGVADVAEKIKTLRIIVIGEYGIELNRKIEYDGIPATALRSLVTWYANPGDAKDFYIFANEEEAGDGTDGKIQYLASKLPSGVSAGELPQTLTELFEKKEYQGTRKDYFGGDGATTNPKKPDAEGEETDDTKTAKAQAKQIADELKAILKAVYFSPKYEPKGNENKEIYLPYTTCYEGVQLSEVSSKDSTGKNNLTMYLVPVATKFFFKFINNRNEDIAIWNLKIGGEVVDKNGRTDGEDFELDDKDKKVMIGGLNQATFLLASVGNEDKEKVFADDQQTYYWVDWLEKVSELSHSHWGSADGNQSFNTKYGWISDYTVPAETDALPWVLVDRQQNSGNYPTVSGKNTEPIDSNRETTFGPYYMPESRYMVTYEQNKEKFTEQRYILNLYLRDLSSASNTGVLDLEIAETIGNVKSLFRNTYVYIVVTMSGGDVSLNIYAEVIGWDVHSVYGAATEQQ